MGVNIKPFIKDAQEVNRKTGIPASIILGQIMLESGGRYPGGLSGLAYQNKNLFGIKGAGNAGSAGMATTEVVGGKVIRVNAGFAKYKSYYDSIMAHAELLSKPRYASRLKNAKTVNDYAKQIKAAGYATDPNYANKLLGIIQSNNLSQYDTGDLKFKPLKGGVSSGNSGTVEADGESTATGSGEDKSYLSTLTFGLFRYSFIIGLVIIGVIFFLKAFPAVDRSAPVKTTKKVVRKVVTKGA